MLEPFIKKLPALSEYQQSVPCNNETICNPSSRESNAFFWPLQVPVYTQNIKKNKMNLKKILNQK